MNIWTWPVGLGEVYAYRTDPADADSSRPTRRPAPQRGRHLRVERPPGGLERGGSTRLLGCPVVLLGAQALVEGLTLVNRGKVTRQYELPLIDA